jgi:integrase
VATATINGKRVRRVSLKSKTDAVQRINDTRDKAARGLPPTDRRIRAQHIFDDWLATKRTAGRKPRTLKRYQQLVDIHLGPGLGHLTLDQLQVDATVQSFFDERKAWHDERGRGLSARTVQAIHDALRAAVNLAIKRSYMHRNAVGRTGTVEIPRPRRKVHVPLSFEESEAFLTQAAGHRHEHLYHVLLTTGIRLGEALAIRISPGADTSWADLERGVLHVRETLEPLSQGEALERGLRVRWQADDLKGERYRDVPRWRDIPLTNEAIAAVKAQQLVVKTNRLHAGKAWHNHGFLFVDEIGEPFTQSNVNHAIKHVGKRAGVERVHAHLLRRTCATYLHAKGVPLATIQAILGHATIGVTMGYIDATALDTLEVARAAMSAAFDDIRRARG